MSKGDIKIILILINHNLVLINQWKNSKDVVFVSKEKLLNAILTVFLLPLKLYSQLKFDSFNECRRKNV